MRKVAVYEDGVAGTSIFSHPSAGPQWVLAGIHLHGIEPRSTATTNLMHAGCCQFMRIHEGSLGSQDSPFFRVFSEFPSPPSRTLKPGRKSQWNQGLACGLQSASRPFQFFRNGLYLATTACCQIRRLTEPGRCAPSRIGGGLQAGRAPCRRS